MHTTFNAVQEKLLAEHIQIPMWDLIKTVSTHSWLDIRQCPAFSRRGLSQEKTFSQRS